MSAIADKDKMAKFWEARLIELLQVRNNLSEEDRGYLVAKVNALKDERLKACVIDLLGWGDDERAELETFLAIALETMKLSKPSLIRQASRNVEIRNMMHQQLKDEQGLSPLNSTKEWAVNDEMMQKQEN